MAKKEVKKKGPRPRLEPRTVEQFQEMAKDLREKAAEFDAMAKTMQRENLAELEFDGIHQFERGMFLVRKFQLYWKRAIEVQLLRI